MSSLINVLKQQAAVYEDILKISQNKTNIIVEGKVTELENLVKLEQSLVVKVGKLESTREELVGKLSEELKLKSDSINVSELVEHLGADESDELRSHQEKILGILGNLKHANELNSRLINNSLEYIDFSINLLTSVDSGNNSYGNSGKVSDSKKRSFLDVKL